MKNTVNDFVKCLKQALGSNLKSVLMYGSMASGEHIKGRSNINVLIVLDNMDLVSLNKVAGIKKKLKFKHIDPLILTKEYIKSSTDTFPMEFLDMKERHLVLFGEDCLLNLKVDLANLRYQCEWELKSKIIQLQKFYVNSNGKGRALNEFFIKALPSFMVIFKNILKLKNISVSDKFQIISKISAEFNLDEEVLNSLWRARTGNLKIENIKMVFEKFLALLQRLSEAVDKLPMRNDA